MFNFWLTLCFILLLAFACNGCDSIAYWQLETFYHMDCRPEHLVNGKCVSTHPKEATPPAAPTHEAQTP
jgi:hypothetical protein